MILDPIELLVDLVRIPSVNPAFGGGGGEREIVAFVFDVLQQMGAEPRLQHVDGERANVLGFLPGNVDATLVFEAHLDTVPMPLEPCPVRVESDRVWGRGACDTKASAAAMLVAMQRLAADDAPRPNIMFAGVVDEEFVMRGAEALIELIGHVDGIVIGEPTNLEPIRAHNGILRFDLIVHGVTAHSSKAHLGTNAITAVAKVALALDERLGALYVTQPHVLTGPGSLTATEVVGGTAPNVVPDRCVLRFDRRLTPSDSAAAALADVRAVLADLESVGIASTLSDPWLDLASVETDAAHPLVTITEAACTTVTGRTVKAVGVPYGTDACKLTGMAGIPSVIVGPGSIDQAHAPIEWVEVREVLLAVDLYADIARRAATAFEKGTR